MHGEQVALEYWEPVKRYAFWNSTNHWFVHVSRNKTFQIYWLGNVTVSEGFSLGSNRKLLKLFCSDAAQRHLFPPCPPHSSHIDSVFWNWMTCYLWWNTPPPRQIFYYSITVFLIRENGNQQEFLCPIKTPAGDWERGFYADVISNMKLSGKANATVSPPAPK